jgi:hypothetical protein
VAQCACRTSAARLLSASLALQAQQVAKNICAFEVAWPFVLKYCRNGKGESKRAALASLLIRDSSEQVRASSNNANGVGGQGRAATVRLSISSLPNFSQIYTVANEEGGIRGESGTALTERAAARLTTRFSALEPYMLGERELQSRCALHLSVFKNTRDNLRVQKRKCPAKLHRASQNA